MNSGTICGATIINFDDTVIEEKTFTIIMSLDV